MAHVGAGARVPAVEWRTEGALGRGQYGRAGEGLGIREVMLPIGMTVLMHMCCTVAQTQKEENR